MKTLRLLTFGVLCLLAAGCLITATSVTDVPITANFNNGFERVVVDITDDVSADQIERIERLDLEGIIRNDRTVADTIDVYISADSMLASKSAVEAATNAYPLVEGYVTKPGPGSLDTLTLAEARAILKVPAENWEAVKTVAGSLVFTIYFTSTGTGISGAVTKGTLFITYTAKPE